MTNILYPKASYIPVSLHMQYLNVAPISNLNSLGIVKGHLFSVEYNYIEIYLNLI